MDAEAGSGQAETKREREREREPDPSNLRSSTQEEDDKQLMGSQAANNTSGAGGRSGRCLCLCPLVAAAVVMGVGLLFLVLGLTVFKARRPTTSVDSVSLSHLDASLDLASLRVNLNVTLDIGLAVGNPNRVGFRYSRSTAFLRYRGNNVGEVPVPDGKIGARETRPLNLTLTLMADRLLSNSALYSDITSGTLPFQTHIRIAGRVRMLFKIHVVTYTTCDLQIELADRALSQQKCRYKTKL
ncbi:uncharacterized protein LOC127251909 [Andrographis paniculata]|uniref:uncharacterized protein LOC127251909 n=1 Tax=Andrographis paniculata TaxID=175694 RepID=UPI0021E88DC4|nr:uncharacterized protein LOC127251909 [Andrographis paniculata]